MLEKLQGYEEKYKELSEMLADPKISSDVEKLREYSKHMSDLEELVAAIRQYRDVLREIEDTKALLQPENDEDLIELAKSELTELKEKEQEIESRIRFLLIPLDPNDSKDIIVEIRAGTGGEEASLFAGDLFRMYARYAENRGWKTGVLSSSPSEKGGFKEVIFEVKGKGAYSKLKYESGVHRVQRVPVTEAQGRIHTSAATVAVLPVAEEVEVKINPEDIRIDIYRSTGPGGQSVNTTDSAVRITHLPTGIVVSCQDEKSQLQNKERALRILRSRLFDMYNQQQQKEIAETRKSQIGTGDRSERIRTYNFPQSRVTDHRVGLTLYRLDEVLNGNIDEFTNALLAAEQAEKIKNLGL
ncbi:MAG: peptide chain release factor 1 [Actinobacteria bacterium]|nr:peptide chain release factor 1 [Actinomycetota bacterium]